MSLADWGREAGLEPQKGTNGAIVPRSLPALNCSKALSSDASIARPLLPSLVCTVWLWTVWLKPLGLFKTLGLFNDT